MAQRAQRVHEPDDSIKIVFISDFEKESTDEATIISHLDSSIFVRYVPMDVNKSSSRMFVCKDKHEMYYYLELVARLLVNDRSQFVGVQVFVPGFPSILLDPIDFATVSVQDTLAETFDHWHHVACIPR
jgi:hypothetical protein